MRSERQPARRRRGSGGGGGGGGDGRRASSLARRWRLPHDAAGAQRDLRPRVNGDAGECGALQTMRRCGVCAPHDKIGVCADRDAALQEGGRCESFLPARQPCVDRGRVVWRGLRSSLRRSASDRGDRLRRRAPKEAASARRQSARQSKRGHRVRASSARDRMYTRRAGHCKRAIDD